MANFLLVDVDNHKYNPSFNPIDAHSQIADYYVYRPPYLDEFFKKSALILHHHNNSRLLDICCGRGELSAGFASFFQHIVAVDGSAEMLKNRIDKKNIDYIKYDLDSGFLDLGEPFENITIGSAIHWLKTDTLKRISNDFLIPGGFFLNTHTLLNLDETPFYSSLKKVNLSFGYEPRIVDLWGHKKFNSIAFRKFNAVNLVKNVSFDVDYLINNQFSYAYGRFHDNIIQSKEHYSNEVRKAVSPYLNAEGRLRARLINWGEFFREDKS